MKPLADLPNVEGFRFIGIRKTTKGRLCADCIVIKKPDGTHSIGGEATFDELCGWEPRQKDRNP